jgi:hypothetical protein
VNAPGIWYCLGIVETGGLLCPDESPFESESDATKATDCGANPVSLAVCFLVDSYNLWNKSP